MCDSFNCKNKINVNLTATVEPFLPTPPSINICRNDANTCIYPKKKKAHGKRLNS